MMSFNLYKSGDVILLEQDAGEKAYLIERGKVEITQDLNGRPIHVAYLGVGQTFGAMNLVTDAPQPTTVIAVEPTWVHEIHRDDFFDALRHEPETALVLLQSLFAYLRDRKHAGGEVFVQQAEFYTLDQAAANPSAHAAATAPVVTLQGLTHRADRALPVSPFRIDTFPFRIGRQHGDRYNDLSIADSRPWQVSKQHLSFVLQDGRVGVLDRGSRLGSLVNGRALGGSQGLPGPLCFDETGGELVLGNIRSAFHYRVTINPA
ncbi:MAG: cyclic nucleotide-binding domain-containing protein [Candidatus Tectomicrobia bacterium]|nr:cyclic nucleotide-binding domain-containing protein [Candidatus Tectomicrobia bacterium]